WFGRDPDWKDVINFRGSKDVEKPVGKWNRIRVIAYGDNIDIYLNNVLVNQAMRVKPSKGRIQIQSEGAEMFVRKVELTPLTL
ncbi:MAG TPA: family 16 glycoside hydrolase, partial [Sphingobacteriaceae bacterium]